MIMKKNNFFQMLCDANYSYMRQISLRARLDSCKTK